MGKQPKIDPDAWWSDPMGAALKDYFEHRHDLSPGERFAVADDETRALMKLELLLQARVVRLLDREGHEISPLVRALAEVIDAAEGYIKEQAIEALSSP
ncbi:MAG: hypothetical protein QM655_11610 [Nocardioidaceae bacterium]